jgi:hypothetical protein
MEAETMTDKDKQRHTPGPWMVAGSGPQATVVLGPRGSSGPRRLVLDTAPDGEASHPRAEDTANAQRIVACVNALAGLNPEGVRECVNVLAGYAPALELLVSSIARYVTANPDQGWVDPEDINAAEAFARVARAAIAMAKGGAQ